MSASSSDTSSRKNFSNGNSNGTAGDSNSDGNSGGSSGGNSSGGSGVSRWHRTLRRGAQKGFRTSWELTKVIAPAYIGVTVLSHTPVLPWATEVFAPAMGVMGLPGEAAVVLVLGNLVNLYAALGALGPLDFTPQEVTTMALMLSFSHNLLVETAVTKRLGVSFIGVLFFRVGLAVLAGVLMNWVVSW